MHKVSLNKSSLEAARDKVIKKHPELTKESLDKAFNKICEDYQEVQSTDIGFLSYMLKTIASSYNG